MDTIAVFKSRSEALSLYKLLLFEGIACATINTPQRLKLGCGLSLVFTSYLQPKVDFLIKKNHYLSFVGFYKK